MHLLPFFDGRLAGRHLAILLGSALLVAILSYVGWIVNVNERFIAANPHWDYDGRVMYDGYGEYAEVLEYLLRNPDAETFGYFLIYVENTHHAERPLYPLMIALANFFVGDIPTAAVLVTLFFSFLAWGLFNRLAIDWFDYRGADLLGLNLLFLFHVGIISSWTRPMTEPLMLVFLLVLLRESARFAQRPGVLRGAGLLLLLAAGYYTKTVLVLGAVLPVVAMLTRWATTPARLVAGAAIGLLAPFALLSAFQLLLLSLGEEPRSFQFLVLAFESLFTTHYGLRHTVVLLGTGAMMVFLAVQVYPLFLFRPREGRLHRWSWRDPRWTLPLAWMVVYVAQRFAFFGFALDYGRARYGVPLVPCMLLLAYPGIQAFARRYRWGAATPWVLAMGNLYVWIVFLVAAWALK